MDLSDDLRRQLEDSVFNYLGPMPTVLGLRVLVGPEAVRELPSGLSPYQHAQWVVRVALGHPDPDVFIGVVRNSDAAGQLLELQAIAAQLEADPGAWSAPAGDPMRLGFRNNFVVVGSNEKLSYLTDTAGGSSGSPICDDAWHVAGLHRGWATIAGTPVKVWGKEIHQENYGTPIGLILAHLAAEKPELHAEIVAGQEALG